MDALRRLRGSRDLPGLARRVLEVVRDGLALRRSAEAVWASSRTPPGPVPAAP